MSDVDLHAAVIIMNLILIATDEIDDAGRLTLSGVRAAHVVDVLNTQPGGTVRLGIIDGAVGVGTVVSRGEAGVELHCTFDAPPPARPAVDLLLAVPRPKVLRRLWAQLAALGVGRILLTNAARVERNYFDTHLLAPDVFRPLLIEGLQQARDTRVPIVSVHRQLKVLVEDDLDTLFPAGMRLVAHPGAAAALTGVVRSRPDERVLLAIGPEGGWNEFELHLLQLHGFLPVGMGPRTLRSDTACVALLSLVHDARAQQATMDA